METQIVAITPAQPTQDQKWQTRDGGEDVAGTGRSVASHPGKVNVHRRQGPSRSGTPLRPIRLRVSPTMATRIAGDAAHAGLTQASWVRSVLADRLAMDDPADRQPVTSYGGGGPDATALTALRMQLHELGGLLVQVAKVARQEGDPARHADAERTLAEVREAIGIIAGWQETRRGS